VEAFVKTSFFLRFPFSWAVGDSSAGALFTPDNKQFKPAQGIRKYYPLLLLASAVLGIPLVWADEHGQWVAAQASLLALLLFLALTIWYWWHANHQRIDLSVAAATYHRALEKLLWCVAIGIFAMITIATRTEHWEEEIVARAVGYGILIAGFSFISGVLTGYLFGLHPTGGSQKSGDQPATPAPQTNLVEIADWLTKIILGAGLVQLTRLPGPIWTFAKTMALGVVLEGANVDGPPVVAEAPNPAMALAIMGFFSTCGLLYGYLWTRYEEAVTSDAAGDAAALSLVNRWLNLHPAPDDQTRLDMMEAVKSASSAAKMRIFLQAEQYRKVSNEDVNDRSLPVFQALVESDTERIFHRSRSQYALALIGKTKDPKNPDDDWRNALDLLNDAIRIRDSSGEPGWHEYEFARAVCRITLDSNFRKDLPSDAQTIQSVQADLNKAKEVSDTTKNLIDKDGVVSKWEGLIAAKAA
jgi:fumarate reductase subunit D